MLALRKINFALVTMFMVTFIGLTTLALPTFAQNDSIKQLDTNSDITLFVGDTNIQITQKEFAKFFAITGKLYYDAKYRSGVEAPLLALPCPTKHPLCGVLVSSRYIGKARKSQHAYAYNNTITTFLENNATKFATEPRDAKFRMNNGRVTTFASSKKGSKLDIAQSTKLIAAYSGSIATGNHPKRIKLASKVINPKIATNQDAQQLGITKLLAEGRSNFAGSPTNRIHNIKVAAARFNGIILAPGEELSFVDLLGPVNGATGYRKELVIIDNQTRPEYGGGVCQVSTTIFRAAIFSGLEITQRRSHSYAVKYYEPIGFDATIYIPNPNLKFRNNTAKHILIQNFIEGTELVFRIYGTPDGRTVDMKGPFITARNSDGSPKKAYFTRVVKDKNGGTIFDETHYSNYKSPRDYPHPGDIARRNTNKPTSKPTDWSNKQWRAYKKANGL